MPVPIVYGAYVVATTAGRIALPILSREFAKRGGTQFLKTYGRKAFEAVTGGSAGIIAYDQINKSVPVSTGEGDYIGDTGEKERERERIATEERERMKGAPAPKVETSWKESFPDQSGKLIDSSPPPSVPEPIKIPQESFPDQSEEFNKAQIFYSKKDDVSKQTKKLVPEKVELGPLTKAEKETALALKGDKPDYYSRIIKAIKETKQTKMPYDQWAAIAKKAGSKEELDYLDIKGKETISKEDLLSEIGFKDIASNIMVTTIPEEDMVSDFEEFSLGFENPGSKKMNVYQIDLPPRTNEDFEFGLGDKLFQAAPAHVKEKYGRNQFLHTRTQVGLGNPDSPPADFGDEAKEIAEKLQNTLIIDEIQSDWIQSIQKYGTKDNPTWIVVKGSDITPEFINKKYGNKYHLRIEKYQTQKDLLEKTGLSTNKVLYVNRSNVENPTRRNLDVIKRIDEDQFYVFSKEKMEARSYSFTNLEDAQKVAQDVTVADFPIKHSKKWVEFALNNEIKNAVLGGQDSIAITNGNIQQSRSKEKGTKKFYDEIVRGQLEKIATKYGVKVEEISFEPDKYLRLQENLKKLKEKGFEETTVTREELVQYITKHSRYQFTNVGEFPIPDFREIILQGDTTPYTSERFDEMVKSLPQETELLLFRNKETGEINFEYPVITKGMLGTRISDDTVEKTYIDFLKSSQQYSDTLGQGVIKMELPKKLQKEILKEPIKFSKAKQQTERLFA